MISLLILIVQSSGLSFTVSGFNSGAYMANQLHIAYSSSITGAGLIGGGPYYCSQSSYIRVKTGCTVNPYLTLLPPLLTFANTSAAQGLIDDLSNLQSSQVFLFSGLLDTIILPQVVHLAEQFYRHYIPDHPASPQSTISLRSTPGSLISTATLVGHWALGR